MTHSVDISQLSVSDLQALRAEIDTQMAARRLAELDKLRADILEMCSARGFTLQEVLAPARKKKNAKDGGPEIHFTKGMTYRNPADPSQTWQGFGQRPSWLRDYLANGGTVEALAAEPAEAPAPKKAASKKAGGK